VGRERGYPLGARGFSLCDADYEDGSVPLQLSLSCADHLHRSAKRRLSPPGRSTECPAMGDTVRELLGIISARQIVVRSVPAPSSLRLRRTADAAMGA
jgi:hypothetical protein